MGNDKGAAATISVTELAAKITGGGAPPHFFDVREADEFRDVHARAAQHLALSAIEGGARPNVDKNATIYVICLSGRRSEKAAGILRRDGFSAVIDVVGGTKAWQEAGLAVDRG